MTYWRGNTNFKTKRLRITWGKTSKQVASKEMMHNYCKLKSYIPLVINGHKNYALYNDCIEGGDECSQF